MRPKLPDLTAWHQAEQLMQPALIRTIDHIRHQLETSDWQGSYDEAPLYPADMSEADRAEFERLRQAWAATKDRDEKAAIEASLAELPQPATGYWLCLAKENRSARADLWELCYQICFLDYGRPLTIACHSPIETSGDHADREGGDRPCTPSIESSSTQSNPTDDEVAVEIDPSLFDSEGEVDWHRLDEKTRLVVGELFDQINNR